MNPAIMALSAEGGGFSIASSIGEISTAMSAVWSMITANPLLSLAVGASIVGIVLKVLKKGKGAAGAGG